MLVLGQLIGETADPGVHLGAAERLVVAVLAGRHLDQRWAAEEDLRALFDQHDVVAHTRDVRAAGRRVAEHQRDRRHAGGRELREVFEHRPTGDEDLGLGRQVGATGFDEIDERQPVLAGDHHRPADLLAAVGVAGAAADRRVVGDDHARDAFDLADPGHDARSHREARAVRRDSHQLEEGCVPVEQQLDPLAGEQFAAPAVPLDVGGAAAGAGHVELLLEDGQLREHALAVGGRVGAAQVDAVRQHGHAAHPIAALTPAVNGR